MYPTTDNNFSSTDQTRVSDSDPETSDPAGICVAVIFFCVFICIVILLCNPEHQDKILLVGFSIILILGSGCKLIADCADYSHRKLRSTKEREMIELGGKRYYYCGR